MEIYAHRGSSGTHPENTITAFTEAAHLAIHGVEFDVHLTKDGELVVIHDERIDRTSNGTGYVKDMTLAKLKTFDFGSWFSPDFTGQTIPTLHEVLQLFTETHHHLNIELKSDIFPYEGMVEKVLAIVSEMGLDSRVVLSSFDHEAIRTVKQLAPHLETAALFMEVLVEPLDYMRAIPADALHLFFPTALRPSIQQVLESGTPVRTFTVNEAQYAQALQDVGVSAIFTDFPEKMMIYLNEKS
ncbi:glycerophosphodiester phosphodiesterase [Sporosarcina sp. FSL K6-3457]|uniref:glycerophosphodiester phosphodiesterase n=1 Tax=Sporosarcina sp. FSL K6-3457 TaxID=2978204 RepID=UPI0030F719AD